MPLDPRRIYDVAKTTEIAGWEFDLECMFTDQHFPQIWKSVAQIEAQLTPERILEITKLFCRLAAYRGGCVN